MTDEKKKANPKTRTGVVVSTDMEKTAIVRVERRSPHKTFKKIITRSKRFYVHDEKNELSEGDTVTIIETRPLSKLKRWRIGSIVERAEG